MFTKLVIFRRFRVEAFLAPFAENPRKIERVPTVPTSHFWHPFPIITGAGNIPAPGGKGQGSGGRGQGAGDAAFPE
jgi:hypothetical protein